MKLQEIKSKPKLENQFSYTIKCLNEKRISLKNGLAFILNSDLKDNEYLDALIKTQARLRQIERAITILTLQEVNVGNFTADEI